MNRHFIVLCMLIMPLSAVGQTLNPQGTIIKPTDSHIQYVGRVSMRDSEIPCWTYPGVQIRTGFQGTSLKMIAKPNSGYFMAQIDGSEAFKICFNSLRDSVVTLAAALPRGDHQVALMYISEGYDRRPEFRGFILDENSSLIDAPDLSERRIEFIGNSITCGYGVEAVGEKNKYQDETSNHYYSYAALTARALKAQHIATARSGIGVYRNYDGPRKGDDINMNTEYQYTCLYDHNEKWDFSRFQPQIVCINLGTNDTSTSGADPSLLKKGYYNLVKQVRKNNPNAKIVLLCGSMMTGDQLKQAKNAMNAAAKDLRDEGEKELYQFDFTPHDGKLKYGADYHPSYWQHQKMAGELTSYLRELMNWF